MQSIDIYHEEQGIARKESDEQPQQEALDI